MSEYEKWTVLLQFLTLLVTVGTLGVTIYFTRQLVKNDNDRENRSRNEQLSKYFIGQFQLMKINSVDSLSSLLVEWSHTHPGCEHIIYNSFFAYKLSWPPCSLTGAHFVIALEAGKLQPGKYIFDIK